MKNRKKRIAIIGHFGGNKTFFDGQTVKTKNLYQTLEKELDCVLYTADTYHKNRNSLKLLWQTLVCLIRCNDVFLLLSYNGMKFFFPLLYFAARIKKINVYHDVIGGNLDKIIEMHPKLCKYLNAFRVNWVETKKMKDSLEKIGLKNAEVLPNFKHIDAVPKDQVSSYELIDDCYTFCTFSRVMAEKGITDAINAISDINQRHGKIIARLDIFGPVEATYQEEFDELIAKHGDCVVYKGSVDSRNSVQTLKPYFALLFPTRWHGEGFPGTVLDCYASAVPVIASDWNSNEEIINHMETGLIYPRQGFDDLTCSMNWAMEHKSEFDSMRKKCRDEYEKYTPSYCFSIINAKLKECEQ